MEAEVILMKKSVLNLPSAIPFVSRQVAFLHCHASLESNGEEKHHIINHLKTYNYFNQTQMKTRIALQQWTSQNWFKKTNYG